MANGNVELRIRARDDSQKTIKQVSKTLDELTAAQGKNAEAAKRGDASVKELESQYKKLENAGKQLLRLHSLTEMFEKQKASLANVRTELDEAKAKHSALAAAMAGATTVTAKMQSELNKAEAAVKRLTKSEADAAARVASTNQELTKFGVNTNDIVGAQAKLRSEIDRTNAALGRQEKIINSIPSSADRAHAKILANLKLQANQLQANIRGYQSLGRVVAGTPSLSSQLTDMMSPAEAARRKIQGLEQEVTRLSQTAKKSRRDLKGIQDDIKSLDAAAKSAIGMAKMIENFQKQTTAVVKARVEYKAAQAEAKALAAQVKAAGTASAEMGAKIQAANARLAEARNALTQNTAAARQSQAALRSAGINTQNLSGEQQRLKNAVQNSTTGINNLKAALDRMAGSARNGSSAMNLLGASGGALSGLIGQVTGLASAYVSLYGSINLAKGAIDAYKVQQQALVKVGTIVGTDNKKQMAEWEYMSGLANKLGIEIETLSKSYTKFAVAANQVGMSQQDAKFIYESIAKTARVFHLSADDMNGVFLALEQMLSKGQVMAEELKTQLGERMPGAVSMYAKSIGVEVKDFLKMMEEGKVDAKTIINYAREQAKAIDAQLAVAEKGVDAVEARAHNALFDFKLAIAKSGFIDAYTSMLMKLTEFMSSDRGEEAAKKFGEAFSAVADGVIWAVENIDMLIDILKVLAGLKVFQIVVGFGKSIYNVFMQVKNALQWLWPIGKKVFGSLGTVIASLGGVTGALKILLRFIPYVGIALLAWDLGTWAYENSEAFRNFVDNIVERTKYLGKAMIQLSAMPGAAIADLLISIMRPITRLFSDSVKSVGKWLGELVSWLPGVGAEVKAWVDEMTDQLTKQDRDMFELTAKLNDNMVDNWKAGTGAIAKDHKEQMESVQGVAKETANAVAKAMEQVKAKAEEAKKATEFEYSPDTGGGVTQRDLQMADLKKEIEKRQAAEVKAELAGRKAMQRRSLAGRLAIIDEEYKAMYDKAKAIGGKEGDEMIAQLNKVVAMAKKAETDQFNAMSQGNSGIDKRKAKIESLTQALAKMNAEITRKQVDADPTSSLADRTSAAIAKSDVKMDSMKADAVKIGGPEGKQLAEQVDALKAANAEYLTEKMQIEEVERLQNKVNTLLEIRKNKIEEINAKRKAGLIDDEQSAEAIRNIKEDSASGINDALSQLESQTEASAGLFSEEEISRIVTGIAKIREELKGVEGDFSKMDTTVVQGVLGGFNAAIDSAYDGIIDLATGAASFGDVMANLGKAVAQFFADFLKKIAMAILQQMLLNALAGMGGGVGAAATAAGGSATAVMHSGGIVGGSGGRSRQASPGLFAGAPRFHSGGFPGLKSTEIPTILEKGEEVLSKNDPRNAMNGGGRNEAAPSQQQNIRLIAVDDRSKIPEAMATAEGESVMLVNLNRNAQSMRSIINRGSSR